MSNTSPALPRRTLLTGAGAVLAAGALARPLDAAAAPPPDRGPRNDRLLRRWACDTWRSMAAMADPKTGLVADNIDANLTRRSGYTSPTNIGGYLWCVVIARDLGFIRPTEARQRIARTLSTLEKMERHQPSGMYYNWYDEASGALLRKWPEDGKAFVPFVSSVDMGWLGAALKVVINADPTNRRAAQRLFTSMRWDMFNDPDWHKPGGATFGGFYTEDPHREGVTLLAPKHGIGGPKVWYTTGHHYDTAISEARMVTYLGIATNQIAPQAYFGTYRTFPPDWTWPEMPPVGEWRTYLGVDVYEGAHRYRGMRIVPGWGGSMFEELMPDLFVDEAAWGPRSWGVNHPLHVRAQREHGMDEAKYGYWGFSPCSNPAGGYREYGVDALGLNPEGYFSDQEKTDYRHDNPPTRYGDGVVTPHASFLAMMHEPTQASENLRRIEIQLGCYGRGGFYDAVATRSGQVARRYLSLDQAMSLGALGNVLLHNRLRRWFSDAPVRQRLRPVIAMETFGAGV